MAVRSWTYPRSLYFLSVCLSLVSRPAAQQIRTVPQGRSELESLAQAACRGKNWDDLRTLAASPETLAWLSHHGRPGDENWQFRIVELPATLSPTQQPNDPATQCLAVFSAYHSCQSIGDHFHRVVKTGDIWKIGAEIPESETPGYRVRDHKLGVKFDLPAKSASFTDDVTIERTDAKPGSVCLVRLSANMTVDSVKQAGQPLPSSLAPGLIAFKLPEAKTSVISLAYRGAFDQPGMDTYVNEREVFLNAYWYPHVGRLPAKHGVTVTVPKGWTAIGQGNPVSQNHTESAAIFTFRNEIPTSYFSLDAGPYHITTRTVNGHELAVYQLTENAAYADNGLKVCAKALSFFENSFGKYPYRRYTLVQTLGPFGGALEAYSFSTYAGRSFGAVAHEVSHTWWGGLVPCPYTRNMWNESFAEYSDGLLARQTPVNKPAHALTGMHQAPNYGRDMQRIYAVPIDRAWDTENGSHSSVGYGKGALVLAMLQDEIGTEKMIAAMRLFVSDHPEGEPGDWPEFERAAKKATGKDFRWFFEQWNERGGVPEVRLNNVKREEGGGGWLVIGEIEQEGKPYRLTLPVVIETASGKFETKKITIDEESRKFSFAVGEKPVAMAIDADGTILMAGGKMQNLVDSPFRVQFR